LNNSPLTKLALKTGNVRLLANLSLAVAVLLPVVLEAALAVGAYAAFGASPLTVIVFLVPALLLALAFALKLKRDAGIVLFALEMFRNSSTDRLVKGLDALAGGDFSITFELWSKPTPITMGGEFRAMKDKFEALRLTMVDVYVAYNTATERLRELVGQVTDTAAHVGAASTQVAHAAEDSDRAGGEIATAMGEVGEAADQQATVVQAARECAGDVAGAATASAAELGQAMEVADRVRTITADGVKAASAADSAMGAVRDSSHSVSSAIGELAARSAEIGAIVKTITGIAGQTNLLALNAAIEAARAGEQGRGFAIVAEEVRKLAEESARAAEQISGLLKTIQGETERVFVVVQDGSERTDAGAEVVERTREAFGAIEEAVGDMHTRIAAVASASEQVSSGSERLRGMIEEVAEVAQRSSGSTAQVSAAAQQSSASAQQLAATALELKTNADLLQSFVSSFRVERDGSEDFASAPVEHQQAIEAANAIYG